MTHKGATVDGMFIILSGHIVIFVNRGGGLEKVMEWKAGDVTGMLPYSRMVTPPGNTEALEQTTTLMIHRDDLREMSRECHQVTGDSGAHHGRSGAAVHVERSARREDGVARQALRPARARAEQPGVGHRAQRGAAGGSARRRRAGHTRARRRAPDDAQLPAVEAIRTSCLVAQVRGVLSPIQQAEREDAIADWLDDHGLESDIADTLAETAVTLDALEPIAAAVDGPSLDAVLRWAAAGCSVRGLASEIQDAAMRISGLVAAVKGFTHMDQGSSAEPVDLGHGSGQHGRRLPVEGTRQVHRRCRSTSNRTAVRPRLCRRTQSDLGEPDRQRARRRTRVAAMSR